MTPQTFTAVVGEHGKNDTHYVLVPFEPTQVWPGIEKVKIPRPDDPRGGFGWLITGSINGAAFDGHIGQRYGNTYIILNDTMMAHAGLVVGAAVEVIVAPLAPLPSKGSAKAATKKKTTKKKATQKKASR